MDQKQGKSVRERAEEWACNNGVPHTDRDMPAWHYDAIAWLAGFKACAEMAAEKAYRVRHKYGGYDSYILQGYIEASQHFVAEIRALAEAGGDGKE